MSKLAAFRKNPRLTILAFYIMVMFGFIASIKGVILPSIRSEFGVDYSKIGLMLFINSSAFLTATFLGGMIVDKFGHRAVMGFGLLFLSLGVTLMPFAHSFVLLTILMSFIGLGLGCFEIGTNSLGAKIFITNTALMMNLLHLFYGVGSSVGPKYAGLMLVNSFSWNYVYLYTLVPIFIAAVLWFIAPFPITDEDDEEGKPAFKEIVKNKKVWFFAGLLGFSIAIELGPANWLVNYLQEHWQMNANRSSYYLSLFFIIFTVGRLVGGYLTEMLGYLKTIGYFTIATFLSFAGGLYFGQNWVILLSLVGFFVSIHYPTIMALLMREFKQNVGSVMGFIITVANIINMLCNWGVGVSTDLFGVFNGFATILVYIVMVIIFLVLVSISSETHDAEKTVGENVT